eukprot:scaffold6638_cov127-Cylindrotheca_fusiformis.AAC.33
MEICCRQSFRPSDSYGVRSIPRSCHVTWYVSLIRDTFSRIPSHQSRRPYGRTPEGSDRTGVDFRVGEVLFSSAVLGHVLLRSTPTAKGVEMWFLHKRDQCSNLAWIGMQHLATRPRQQCDPGRKGQEQLSQ